MNQVYYGNHAYGIEAAAQTYFSKHARNLWLAQAAMLAGLPQAPSVYDPFHRPAAALARRDEVLRAMLQYGAITPAQYREAVPPQGRQALHANQGAVLLQLRPRPADRRVWGQHGPDRRAARLHDDRPTAPARRSQGGQEHAQPAGRPRVGGGLDRPGDRRDPRDDSGDPGPNRKPVQPRRAGAATARLHVQGVRPDGRDRRGHEPRLDLLHLGAVPLPTRPVHVRVGCPDL